MERIESAARKAHRTNMSDFFERIERNSFLLIGRVGMDFTPPPSVRTEDATTMSVAMGGSAANTAAGIVKLGGAAALLTRVSDDSIGRYCVNQLRQYGVDASHVRAVDGPHASEYRNSLAVYETRIADHQSVIYRNGAADFQMNLADVEAADYATYGALVTAGTVFAAEPSRSAAFRAFELARTAGLPIVFDIDYRPYSWPSAAEAAEVLSCAGAASDVIVGNDEEFGFMAGAHPEGFAKARELAHDHAALVVYKRGEHGAVTFAGGEESVTGVFEVEAIKPTGAGDSFMAGLLVALAEGRPVTTAVERGSACAAITVTRPGCAPAMPDARELEAFLAEGWRMRQAQAPH